MQQPLDSKEHRWREATVVGQALGMAEDLPEVRAGGAEEGKVIKVNKGKSFVEGRRK
jgi:hypothetical protein